MLQAQPTASSDSSGIDLKPNILRVTASLTNKNPDILALLEADSSQWGWPGQGYAESTNPRGYSASTETVTYLSPMKFTFDMLVEAAAGGADGVVYNVRTSWKYADVFNTAADVRVKPRNIQPDPTEVELKNCVGVVQVLIAEDESCKKPATGLASYGMNYVNSYTTPDGALTTYVGADTAGATRKTSVYYQIHTSAGWVKVTEPVEWSNVKCDQIIRQCKVVQKPTLAFGGLNGPLDVLGESLANYRQLFIYEGPGGASESRYETGIIQAPIEEPSKWWHLQNLSPGSYQLVAQSFLRRGRHFTAFVSPPLAPRGPVGGVTVEAGKNLTLNRVINGELRYPFVMKPAFFYGSVRLADPFVPHNPGSTSTLQDLYFKTDYDDNGDGIPNNPGDDSTSIGAGVRALGGYSTTGFPGHFLPGTGELASTYEQVLPGTYDLPYSWYQTGLDLFFRSEGANYHLRPGEYDPDLFRYGSLQLIPSTGVEKVLSPGDRYRIDHAYCFNEVKLLYRTDLGRFINPTLKVRGSYNGLDWRQQPVNYSVTGSFVGDPFVSPSYYEIRADDPKSQGQLYLTLPQGTFNLSPEATLVSDSGATNRATFSPISLTTGCGQRLNVVPPLVVLINPVNRCASGKTSHITGQVKSGSAVVDRLTYRVNDGPPVELCTNCGTDPNFAFDASLQSCENTVKVFAENHLLPEPATGSQQIVWDEPTDGPSCPGTACLNQPPVARCRNLVVPVGASSQGCGSVDDGSYDPDPSDTVSCAQGPACPYALGANTVTLTCKDSAGNTSSCEATVTVRDLDPPTITCPSVPPLTCVDGGAIISLSPTAHDASGAVTTMCTPASGTRLPPGLTTAVCTATDAAGNRASCSVDVTVNNDGPTVLTCPEPLVRECVSGALITPPPATTSGSCRAVSVQSPPASTFPLGTTPLIYTATDSAGAVSSCTTSLTVRDTQPPTLVLSGASSLTLVKGVGTFTEPGFSASDVCAGNLTTQVQVSGTVNADVPGHYTLTYSVQDASGLSATTTRVIDVVESSQGPAPGPGPGCESNSGAFMPTPTGTASLHLQHTATPLGQGGVLVVGGFTPSAELYDEATNTWVSTGSPLSTHRLHTATLLSDGRVLVAGGEGADPSASAELYEPLSGSWSSTNPLLTPRHEHAAVRLADGRVLVIGGKSTAGSRLASAELYTPSTGLWSSAGSMAHARRSFTATLLANGRVLVTGGLTDDGDECLGSNCLASAEVYDPHSGTWSTTGSMTRSRGFHSAVRLADGRVLVSGGDLDGPSSAHAELYDPASGTWTATGDMRSSRRRHSLTPLPNGQILAVGGYDAWTGILSSAELYTPATGTWCATGSLGQNRYEHTATLLSSGRVLITAGFSTSSQYTSELFGF
ncbi:kelch repeat-containing protein [Archangium sp.]|uniref:kelch repeat-containing protein n=1 Tax=Archangium sp. TaxID=1872627 RepID=UPI00286BBFB8|nr:kelch repeat-containing protein [Archangium sp.]